MIRVLIPLLFAITFSASADTFAEIDAYLHAEIAARLGKAGNCKCECLREAEALWNAREALRAVAPNLPNIARLGDQIQNDLRANHCTATASAGRSTGGSRGGFTGSGGGGTTDMRLPDIFVAASRLDETSQKKLFDQLDTNAKLEWREWALANKSVAEKLYGEELTKQLLNAGTPAKIESAPVIEYSAEQLAEMFKKAAAKAKERPTPQFRLEDGKYKIDLEKIEKKIDDSVKPPNP